MIMLLLNFGILETITIMLSLFILSIIIRRPIEKKKSRQWIVRVYMFFYKLTLIIMIGGILLIQLMILNMLYKGNYCLIIIISENENLALYLALTISLISCVPITLCFFKYLIRKQYMNSKIGKGVFANADKDCAIVIQSTYYSFIKKIIDVLNRFPFMGIIHIINMVLVIAVNIIKALNISVELTTTSIYMGIATFYAVDKVIDYFKKKYSEFWKILDNKIFLTKEIEQKILFDFNDMFKVTEQVFCNYIDTGKYEITDEIKQFLKKKT